MEQETWESVSPSQKSLEIIRGFLDEGVEVLEKGFSYKGENYSYSHSFSFALEYISELHQLSLILTDVQEDFY